MGARILIVDKHPAFRRDLALYLSLLDQTYELVGEAATAEEALARIAMLRPDIVLLDVNLPDYSGLIAARQIRDNWPRTRTIVISNDPAEDYRRAALEAGAVEYVDELELAKMLPAALALAAKPAILHDPALSARKSSSAGHVALAQRFQGQGTAVAAVHRPAPFEVMVPGLQALDLRWRAGLAALQMLLAGWLQAAVRLCRRQPYTTWQYIHICLALVCLQVALGLHQLQLGAAPGEDVPALGVALILAAFLAIAAVEARQCSRLVGRTTGVGGGRDSS